jgi:hypothetical protein
MSGTFMCIVVCVYIQSSNMSVFKVISNILSADLNSEVIF